MPEPLAPKLKQIKVKYECLVLDPNNPRLITRKEDRIREEDYLEQDLAGITLSRLFPGKKDRYKIDELVNSIKQNHWLPVDFIFVRKLKGDDKRYVVLEGNRRVAAIRKIMTDQESPAALKEELQSIEVMEVLDSASDEDLQSKITYLLGVRHHGSLKRWTPFAQAHTIFERYLGRAMQTPENFKWDLAVGQKIADTLSIQVKEVQERLKVYRVMAQIGNSPDVKKSPGGMKDRYYSVCAEPLLSPRKKLGGYLNQDPSTFLLSDEGAARIKNLCRFSEPNRGGETAPINNPEEWRSLDRILADEDISKRDKNLREVEENHRHPSQVWAERSMELYTYTWEKWLVEVNSILKRVSLGDDFSTDNAKQTAKKLVALIKELDRRDRYPEATSHA
jgi:hypothetical protein